LTERSRAFRTLSPCVTLYIKFFPFVLLCPGNRFLQSPAPTGPDFLVNLTLAAFSFRLFSSPFPVQLTIPRTHVFFPPGRSCRPDNLPLLVPGISVGFWTTRFCCTLPMRFFWEPPLFFFTPRPLNVPTGARWHTRGIGELHFSRPPLRSAYDFLLFNPGQPPPGQSWMNVPFFSRSHGLV